MGRPSLYTVELGEQICERLMDGESLVKICSSESMPSRSTVMRWQNSDPDFEAKCARARLMQADLMDDKILDEANACDEDNYQAAKVRISAYQWRASKLAPKKYGDKVQAEVSGADGGPIQAAIAVTFVRTNGGQGDES